MRDIKINIKELSVKICLVVGVIMFSIVANGQDLQADNMLLFQRDNGGWFKQFHGKAFSYDTEFSEIEKDDIAKEVKEGEATIDNGATTKEIRYLVKAYKQFHQQKYIDAAEKGIQYLLNSQYENGGWPQYYPDKRFYRAEITFNDNAIINVMNLLQDVKIKSHDMEVLPTALISPCATAIEKGIDCILKTQIKVDGVLTAWCQQYDEVSLQPAKARAYELPSITAAESAYIIEFLMNQPNPSKEVRLAISSAITWFDKVKIKGFKFKDVAAPGTIKGVNRQIVADSAAVTWARYYEIGTNRPFFSDRDGVKKYDVQAISYERRNGYAWYGVWPMKLLYKEYPVWVKKNSN